MKSMDPKTIKQLEQIFNKSLLSLEKRMGQKFATKKDLKVLVTRSDLKHFTRKADLLEMKNELLKKIDDTEMNIIATVDKHKADKDTFEQLNKRVSRLEQEVFPQ